MERRGGFLIERGSENTELGAGGHVNDLDDNVGERQGCFMGNLVGL